MSFFNTDYQFIPTYGGPQDPEDQEVHQNLQNIVINTQLQFGGRTFDVAGRLNQGGDLMFTPEPIPEGYEPVPTGVDVISYLNEEPEFDYKTINGIRYRKRLDVPPPPGNLWKRRDVPPEDDSDQPSIRSETPPTDDEMDQPIKKTVSHRKPSSVAKGLSRSVVKKVIPNHDGACQRSSWTDPEGLTWPMEFTAAGFVDGKYSLVATQKPIIVPREACNLGHNTEENLKEHDDLRQDFPEATIYADLIAQDDPHRVTRSQSIIRSCRGGYEIYQCPFCSGSNGSSTWDQTWRHMYGHQGLTLWRKRDDELKEKDTEYLQKVGIKIGCRKMRQGRVAAYPRSEWETPDQIFVEDPKKFYEETDWKRIPDWYRKVAIQSLGDRSGVWIKLQETHPAYYMGPKPTQNKRFAWPGGQVPKRWSNVAPNRP